MGKVLSFKRKIKDGAEMNAAGKRSDTRPEYLNDKIVVVERGDRIAQRDESIRNEANEYNKKYGN